MAGAAAEASWPATLATNSQYNYLHSIYAESAPPLSSFDQWKTGYGLAANVPASSDSDGDGISLFGEYSLALNPQQSSTPGLPALSLDSGAATLSLTYFRARAELLYTVKTSTDLQSWTALGVTQSSAAVGLPNTATFPLTGEPRRFLRLEITQP